MSEAIALAITPEEVQVVKSTIAQGATESELKLYLYDCQRQGVHPLDRMIHFTKRGGKYVPITSIDFLRSRAEATGQYAGCDDIVFDDEQTPTKATITIYKLVDGVRCPFTATARWNEYYPGETSGHMWRKMPCTMLGKVVESIALKRAFPKQLGSLYSGEELEQTQENIESSEGSKTSEMRGRDSSPTSPLPVVKSITSNAKKILNAEEIQSLLETEPTISETQIDQPPVEFGNLKAKKDVPYYERVEGELLVYNSFPIKDKLKRNGFKWNMDSKTWNKPYTAFDESTLKEMINPKKEDTDDCPF